jgi:hypothetical protein
MLALWVEKINCRRRFSERIAMQGHVLANTELIGTYQKGDR